MLRMDDLGHQIALKKECDRTRREMHERRWNAEEEDSRDTAHSTATRRPESPTRLRTAS